MDLLEHETERPNPSAHPALSLFAFLIGDWQCQAHLLLEGGEWQHYEATWRARYILSGYVIADEYRMTDSSGKLIVLGMSLRVFDPAHRTWHIKWLNALAGTWIDLGPKELGGVRYDGQSVTYVSKEPLAAHPYSRATYTDISEDHFTWRGERSADGNCWNEFMVIDCDRIAQ